MKKALKKILALVATGAMAISAFAMSASAASCVSWCHYHDQYDTCYTYGYYNGDYATLTLTANQVTNGTITADLNAPANATVEYSWTELEGVAQPNNSKIATITALGADPYSATCTASYSFTYGPTGNKITVKRTVTTTISGYVYNSNDPSVNKTKIVSNRNYIGDFYPSYPSDWYEDGYWWNGKWYPYYDYDYPSYVRPSRAEYEVDWDTDTFYYNGRKQVPSATVTIGKRTIDLDVKIISGDKDSTDVGSYRASASLPSGYRGYKLSGSTLRYTIEEPLRQGLTSENGGTYYYNNGKAETGWKTVSGDTYYFEKDGRAATGWEKLDGKWYYFDTNGIMQTGWVRANGKIYYTNDSGVMIESKWMKLDGYWYYFNADGAMAESQWVKTDGKWYYLAADGKMATNTTIPGGYRVDANGVWVK